MVRPCLRMNFDLCDNSASGTDILCRSASDIWIRSTSRSVRMFSSTPRNAHSIYQSHMTRKTMREKKSSHSSSEGIPGLASRGGGGSSTRCRSRDPSSMKSPVSSKRGGPTAPASKAGSVLSSWSSSELVTIGSLISRSAFSASGVRPCLPGILPTSAMCYDNLCWLVCRFFWRE